MKSHPPTRMHPPIERAVASLLATLLLTGMPLYAWAAPQGEQVVSGQASFSRNGNTTVIEAGNNAIINYSGFDIGAQETVQFVQPGITARVLNRVLSADPTQIDGSLLANGQVYIINPSGVFFGGSSIVNVGGLVAAAGELTNDAFLASIDSFTNLTGPVENFGAIHAKMVSLLGQTVANHGAIIAPDGLITMVAGDNVILTKMGDRIRVHVMSDGEPTSESASGVTNTGTLDAGENGEINMTAGDVYSIAVSHSGTAVARRMHAEGAGLVDVAGDVTADDVSLDGGAVNVTGSIDASGAEGGGSVLVGGKRTKVAIVGPSASILADAIQRGDGGSVIVAASDIALVFGQLQARGGAAGGDGGLVETSAGYLEVTETPDVSAPAGEGGHWLIDPTNVEVVDNAIPVPNVISDLDPLSPNFTPNGEPMLETSQISDDVIETALNAGSTVTIDTFNPGDNEAGDITVSQGIEKTAGADASLILRAANDVNVNQAISSTSNRLHVTLSANDATLAADDGNTAAGAVNVNANVLTNGGNFQASGVGFSQAGATSITTTSNVGGTPSGDVTITSNNAAISALGAIDTSGASPGGNVILTANNADLNVASIDSSGSDGGQGGNVTLETVGSGNIVSGSIDARGGANNNGAGGAGGEVGIASAGTFDFALGTDTIDSSGGASTVVIANGGAAGGVDIEAAGNLGAGTMGDIVARGGDSENALAGAGGLVDLESLGGSLVVASVTTSGGDGTTEPASGGAGGDQVLTASGSFSFGGGETLDASGGSALGTTGSGGNGGSVLVSAGTSVSASGDVDTSGGDATGTGSAGAGGPVQMTAGSTLDFGSITTAGGAAVSGPGGAGGSVSLTSGDDLSGGAITTSGGNGASGGAAGAVTVTAMGAGFADVSTLGAITATGGTGSAGAGGAGGTISLAAGDDIGQTAMLGAIDSSGGEGTTTGGDAGDVTLTAATGNDTGIDAGTITAGGGNGGTGAGGNGGSVTLTAAAGTATASSISTGGGNSTSGAGGDAGAILVTAPTITFTGASPVLTAEGGDSVTADGGKGGAVHLAAAAGGISLTNAQVSTQGGSSTGGGGTGNGGMGGAVTFLTTSGGNIALAGGTSGSDVTTNGGDAAGSGNGGKAGAIRFESDTGDITAAAGSTLTATGGDANSGAGGMGGDVLLKNGGTGTINIADAVDFSGGSSVSGPGGMAGSLTTLSGGDTNLGNILLAGGSSVSGDGGDGGTYAPLVNGNSNLVFGSVDVSGGDSLPGDGGDGGAVILAMEDGNLTFTSIDASGGDALDAGDGGAGGRIDLSATGLGSIAVNSLADASGGSSVAGNGGAGGQIAVVTNVGNITIVAADASGGDVAGAGNAGGAGGQGGAIALRSTSATLPGTITVGVGALDASGGRGVNGAGGSGGDVNVETAGLASLTSASPGIDVSGGDSVFGNAGAGGNAFAHAGALGLSYVSADVDASGGDALAGNGSGGQGGTATLTTEAGGHIAIDANSSVLASGGSAAAGNGGNGGSVVIDADGAVTGAAELAASGGDSQQGSAGSGGQISVTTGTGNITVVAADASGGDVAGVGNLGAAGGQGGAITLRSTSGNIAVGTGALDASGGRGVNGAGGAGGQVNVETAGQVASTGTSPTIDVSGGNSVFGNGGAGGNAFAHAGALGLSYVSADVDASGGDALAGNGSGGAGGSATLSTEAGGGIAMDSASEVLASGGSAANGNGGNGGSIVIDAAGSLTGAGEAVALGGDSLGAGDGGDGGDVTVTTVGTLTLQRIATSGGSSAGAGAGGNGGPVDVMGGGAVNLANGFGGIAASGGASQAGPGGNGATVTVASNDTVSVAFTLNQGGDSTDGPGGDGGEVTMTAPAGVTATIVLADGGDSAGAGTGGAGGRVALSSAATVSSANVIDVSGGGSQQADGGAGGEIDVDGDSGANLTDLFAFGGDSQQANGGAGGLVGVTTLDGLLHTANVDVSGGNALQDGDGGDAGDILLESGEGLAPAADNTIQVEGDLLADGGRAFGAGQGGQGGPISLHVGASGVASRLLVTGKADTSGGDSQEADGGDAGNLLVNVGDGDVLWAPAADGIAVDTRGGSSLAGNTTGNGGNPGTIDVVTGTAGTSFVQDIVFGAPADHATVTAMGGSSGPIPADPVNQAGNGLGRGTDGADVTMVAGQLGAAGTGGDLAVFGVIDASGGTGANVGGGTDGGNVSLRANNGSIGLTSASPGIVTSGTSSTDGDGGDAGTVDLTALGTPGDITRTNADIEAQGGLSWANGNGGHGGDVTLLAANGITASGSQTHTEGGTALDGSGNDAGAVAMTAGAGGIILTDSAVFADGGGSASNGDGGNGGTVDLAASGPITVIRSALRSNGGASVDGNGGDGNDVTLISAASAITLDASNVLARGGDVFLPAGGDAGDGGNATLFAEQGITLQNGADLLLEGGSTESIGGGAGGDGGDASVISRTAGVTLGAGSQIHTLGGDVAGDGNTGDAGAGGDVRLGSVDPAAFPLPNATLFVSSEADIDTSGGHVTGVGASGNGGNAGSVLAEAIGFVAQNGDVTAEGGDIDPVLGAGSTGDGGQGGPVTLHSHSGEQTSTAADFSTRGGDALTGSGGDGGDVTLLGDGGDVVSDPNILTRGGHSSDPAGAGNGGNGGMVRMTAGDGDVLINDGGVAATTISTIGGNAAGTGQAGNGGDVMLAATEGRVAIGSAARTDVTTNGGDDGDGDGGTAGDISAISRGGNFNPDILVNGDLTALPGNGGTGTGYVALVVQNPTNGGEITITADPDPASPRIHAGDFVLMDAADPINGVVTIGDEADVVAKDHVDQAAADKLAAKGVDVTGLVEGAKGIKIRNAGDGVLLGANVDLRAENGAISVFEGVPGILLMGGAGTENVIDGNGDFYTELAAIDDAGAPGPDSLTISDEGDIFIGEINAGQSVDIQNDLAVNVDDDGDGAHKMTFAGGITSAQGNVTLTGTNLNDDIVIGGDVNAVNGTVEMSGYHTVQLAAQGGGEQQILAQNIYLNAPNAQPLGLRTSVPPYATVARSFDGDLTIQASQDVRFGHNEKLSVPGKARVIAGGDVAIGDVAALDVSVNAGDQITINTRSPGGVELPGGGAVADQGVDIVGNKITFVAPGGIVRSGLGSNTVTLGTPTAFTEDGEMNAQLLAHVETGEFQVQGIFENGRPLTTADFYRNGVAGDQPASDVQGSRMIQSSHVLDIAPQGQVRGNVGENFAGVAAANTQNPDGGTNQAAVSELPLRENALLAYLECGSEDDLQAAEVESCEENAVGDLRADSDAAQSAKEAYDELFGSHAERAGRVAQRKAQLAAALDAGDMDAPVLASIRQLFDAVNEMGLAEDAMAAFQSAVLQAVQPSGRTLEEVWSLLAASY